MSYPGEYVENLPRITNVFCQMTSPSGSGQTSGFACARVSREDPIFFQGSGDSDEAQVYLQNIGSTTFQVLMKQCNDYSAPGTASGGTPTGTRFNVGTPQVLVPGGKTTLQVSPYQQFLEFWCMDGRGQLKAQVTGVTRWQRMAFDKTETIQDTKVWNAKPTPVAPFI